MSIPEGDPAKFDSNEAVAMSPVHKGNHLSLFVLNFAFANLATGEIGMPFPSCGCFPNSAVCLECGNSAFPGLKLNDANLQGDAAGAGSETCGF